MTTINEPLISVVIINYNGKEFLFRCLSSVLKSNYGNFELLFVDNNSIDGSIEYVKNNFRDNRLKIIENDANYGVPGGRNIGFQKAQGEYIVFLDNDAEVESAWLKELIKVFQTDFRIVVAQCKLLNMSERKRFDHAGDYLTPFGFLFERSKQSRDLGQFDSVDDIFNAKGAATVIKSSVFKELGMYDDSYFMYLEETDFCFRAWLAGYRVVFVPKSIVWHAFETPLKDKKVYYSNYVIRYYGCRNYITTLIKNLSFLNLVKILPFHIICWFVLSLSFLLKGKPKDSFWILKGITWNFLHISDIFKKRFYVQKKIRKVKDANFMKKIMIHQGASFYLKKALSYLK